MKVEKNLFQKVDTVFVTVENMERSVEWYRDCLGLKLVWQNEFIAVMATEGETPVTLINKQKVKNEQPLFNFLTDDIDKAHARLTEKGVEADPILNTEGIKTFDFKDPDGNRLNVCYLKPGE